MINSRKVSTLTFLLLLSLIVVSQPLVWSDPIEVATGFGNLRPRLALTTGDVPVIVWGGGTGSQPVYVTKWKGVDFGTPIAVSPQGINPYTASWVGPDIAASNNDVWVVFDAEVGNQFRVYSVKSTDGGASFSDTVNVGGYSGLTRFTAIGTDNEGNPVVTFMEHNPGWIDPRYVVANSIDGGNSWESYVDASNSLTGNEVCDCCPAEVVTDGTNQMLMFRNNDSNLRDMWASVSSDGGQSFLYGEDVDDAEWKINACPSTGPDGFMRGDSVIMVWMTAGYGNPGRVMLNSVSKANGMGRANQMINPSSMGVQNYPRIYGDDQVFGIVYQEYIDNSLECMFAYSTNGTTQFDEINILINENEEGSQMNPDIIYSDGVFHFTYQDNQTGSVMYRTADLQGVGIRESINSTFVLFPNPSKDILNIKANQEDKFLEISILNSYSQEVQKIQHFPNKATYQVDISALSSGIYFVQIKTNQGFAVQKFLKK